MKNRNVYLVAGPNGAGKTTFALKFLPKYAECPCFINADLIAQGLSPFSPAAAAIRAGKLVIEQIHQFANRGVDFAFETTLSGKLYINLLKKLKTQGYKIHIFFLWIPNVNLAISRIKNRVIEGGHNIPKHVVLRRFYRSIHNFIKLYQPLADSWLLFNNAGEKPLLVVEKKNGKTVTHDQDSYNDILKSIGAI